MSLRSNYEYIRDWVNAKFLKKEDATTILDSYATKENVNEAFSDYSENLNIDQYLTKKEYDVEENIIASALTDLDARIENLPNTGKVLGEKEEKVIAHVLIDLNDRLETIEDADYPSQIQNAGRLDSVTLNNIPATLNNRVANLSLTTNAAGSGNVVTGVTISGTTVTVTKGNVDVSDKESVSNKVTSISSSSTDTQYPSAKSVYTAVGNVESVLNQIITPTPQLSVPDTLSVVSALNTTTSTPFRIVGDYLTGNVTLSGAANGITYTGTTSTNTVAKANALAGRDMAISYTPTSAGPHTATINFASSGATTKSMVVTGTVVTPTITTSLSGDITLAASASETFTLSGTELLGNVTLTPSIGFSVSPTSITTENALLGGVSVTVTNDTAADNGTLTIASLGATSVVVNLVVPE